MLELAPDRAPITPILPSQAPSSDALPPVSVLPHAVAVTVRASASAPSPARVLRLKAFYLS